MMNVGNQFNNNCSNGSNATLVLKMSNYINVATSAACLTFLLLLLALLVLYKAYKTTLQRLLFHLIVSTALYTLIATFNIELQFNTDSKSWFCEWLGFSIVWTSNLVWLFSFALTVYITITVYQKFRGEKLMCLEYCQRHSVLTEVVCTLAMTFLPFSYLLVPAVHHNYGYHGDQCFMKRLDENCKPLSHSKGDYTILEAVDISLHFIVCISFILLIAIILANIMKVRRSKKESVISVGRTVFLIIMVGTTLCIRTMQVGWNLSEYHNERVNQFVYIVSDPVYTIINLMASLGFTVYLYSPKKLGFKSLQKAAKQWPCKHSSIKIRTKHNIGDDDGLVSAKPSVRQDVPSETQSHSPCYTNQFTNINVSVTSTAPKYGAI